MSIYLQSLKPSWTQTPTTLCLIIYLHFRFIWSSGKRRISVLNTVTDKFLSFSSKLSAKSDEMQLVIRAKDGLFSRLFYWHFSRRTLYWSFVSILDPINLFVLEMDSNGVTSLDFLQSIVVSDAT